MHSAAKAVHLPIPTFLALLLLLVIGIERFTAASLKQVERRCSTLPPRSKVVELLGFLTQQSALSPKGACCKAEHAIGAARLLISSINKLQSGTCWRSCLSNL